jgi:hypothetical protein
MLRKAHATIALRFSLLAVGISAQRARSIAAGSMLVYGALAVLALTTLSGPSAGIGLVILILVRFFGLRATHTTLRRVRRDEWFVRMALVSEKVFLRAERPSHVWHECTPRLVMGAVRPFRMRLTDLQGDAQVRSAAAPALARLTSSRRHVVIGAACTIGVLVFALMPETEPAIVYGIATALVTMETAWIWSFVSLSARTRDALDLLVRWAREQLRAGPDREFGHHKLYHAQPISASPSTGDGSAVQGVLT